MYNEYISIRIFRRTCRENNAISITLYKGGAGFYPDPVNWRMKIQTIVELLHAEVLCGEENLSNEVCSACGSDMMSDVLAYVKEQAVLLTGLVNPQVIRTAEMMDMRCIVFVRGKKPSEDMVALAEDSGIVLLSTAERMFVACGKLYACGLAGEGDLS